MNRYKEVHLSRLLFNDAYDTGENWAFLIELSETLVSF